MISLSIKLTGTQCLTLDATALQGLCKAAANEVQITMQDNFDSLGGREFWGRASDATTVEMQGELAVVGVRQPGVRLQWLGTKKGQPILPGKRPSSKTGQPTKLLAIPCSKAITEAPNAYGMLAFELVKNSGHTKGLLFPGESVTIKRGKRKGQQRVAPIKDAAPLFRLVDQTEHDPHPEVIPSENELKDAARRGSKSYLRALKIKNRKK